MKINLNRVFLNLLRLGCLLALVVIILGAYVRLSDAGLGCPDWPGCYGKLIVPEGSISQVEEMNLAYPERLFEKDKAWKEMLHRYLASALGFLILMLAALTWFKTQFLSVRLFSSILLALVMFQGLLGMWTVTLLLKPVVVMLHACYVSRIAGDVDGYITIKARRRYVTSSRRTDYFEFTLLENVTTTILRWFFCK